jgi:hypothetical protein
VHSFEFWFTPSRDTSRGCLGASARATDPPLPDAERESLITVLCNYCVGESAALVGASGLVAIAPNA